MHSYMHSSKITKHHSYMHSSKITKQKKIKFHSFIYAFLKNNKTKKKTSFMHS